MCRGDKVWPMKHDWPNSNKEQKENAVSCVGRYSKCPVNSQDVYKLAIFLWYQERLCCSCLTAKDSKKALYRQYLTQI